MRYGIVQCVLNFEHIVCLNRLSHTGSLGARPNVLMKVRLGDTVTLRCIFNSSQLFYMSWYKQPFGQKPRLMVQAYKFKNVAQLSDSAVYYCASLFFNEVTFGDGTILILTGKTVVQQLVSDPVRPGDSVTLQCTVDGETCAGEHSVYWFRHGSGESLPGLIYTHGNRRDECEKSPEAGSPTHSCVYSLPKRNLSRSDAGIYYCAVATCGNILFGNGTKINMEDAVLKTCVCVCVCVCVCIMDKSINFTTAQGKLKNNFL
uniref:Novel immune-type receptor 9 n=1 Tax=Scleropages formosus TaxID=113540 RepID=A0A8C9S005_SCLFO